MKTPLDLSLLDRPRLEALAAAAVDGLASIKAVLEKETTQLALVKAQAETIAFFTERLTAMVRLNAELATTTDGAAVGYRSALYQAHQCLKDGRWIDAQRLIEAVLGLDEEADNNDRSIPTDEGASA